MTVSSIQQVGAHFLVRFRQGGGGHHFARLLKLGDFARYISKMTFLENVNYIEALWDNSDYIRYRFLLHYCKKNYGRPGLFIG